MRERGAGTQNLDSLLDTMANVVGILVVLMAVTQVTVNEAFDRIRVAESEQAREVARQREAAERALAEDGAEALADALEIAQMRAHVERLKGDPEAARISDDTAAATQLAAATLKVRRLEEEIGAKEAELGKLRIHMAEYEAQPTPSARDLRLPDPRPAPPNASEVVFLCRYGRVLYPDLERLFEEFVEVTRRTRGVSPAYFRDHDVGNRDLRWQVSGGLARLDWRRRTAGETVDEIRRGGSAMKAALARYDPQRYYVMFYVWGDSFEVYLEARRYAESQGFDVGWEVWETGRSLKFGHALASPPAPID